MTTKNWITKILTQATETQDFVTPIPDGLLLQIWVQPNSTKNEIVGIYSNRLKVKIASPALDGKANKELCDFLADQFSLPKKNINVVTGLTRRRKTVQINFN